MASSISITSSSQIDNRRMKLSCVQQSKSSATNKSTIKWTLSVTGEDNYYYDTGPTSVYINGTRVYYKDRIAWSTYQFPAKVGSTSGTIEVPHTTDGSKTISVSLSTAIYYGQVKTDSKNWTLDKIARGATIETAPDFTDEQDPTITYANPAGTAVSSLQACIGSTDGQTIYVPYRDIDISGTEYTFELTSEERTALRTASATSNTLPVKFYIKTVISSTTLYSEAQKTLTIVNATPTITSATAVDVNSTTTALTGSSGTVVKGYSNVKVSDIVASAYKNATLEQVVVDSISEAYTSGYQKTINGYTKNNIGISVVDSRGNTSTILTKTFTFVDYFDITKGNITATRANSGVGEAVTLALSGTWFNGSFGSQANTLTATYRFKEHSASQWTTGATTLTITKSGNNYSINQAIRGDISTGFDVSKSFDLEVIFTDKLSTATFSVVVGSGTPAIAILGNKIALGGKYETSDNETIQFRKPVNDKYIKHGSTPLNDYLDGEFVDTENIADGAVTNSKLDLTTRELSEKQIVGTWQGKTVYRDHYFVSNASTWGSYNIPVVTLPLNAVIIRFNVTLSENNEASIITNFRNSDSDFARSFLRKDSTCWSLQTRTSNNRTHRVWFDYYLP